MILNMGNTLVIIEEIREREQMEEIKWEVSDIDPKEMVINIIQTDHSLTHSNQEHKTKEG